MVSKKAYNEPSYLMTKTDCIGSAEFSGVNESKEIEVPSSYEEEKRRNIYLPSDFLRSPRVIVAKNDRDAPSVPLAASTKSKLRTSSRKWRM